MEHYVTIFDSNFLPQGLALYRSMQRHLGEFALWVLCVDDAVYLALEGMNFPSMHLLNLPALETESLKRIKTERTRGEYCWTLTPFAPRFVFEADASIERVTYLDADLWFMNRPDQIFDEFNQSGKSVMITEHAYAPEYDQTETSGKYCVQFMIFAREKSEVVRKWWEDRCVEWCYARSEDGKFGDQKYLDDWPIRFPEDVHVLQERSFALAPWNAIRFPYSDGVFWHFHSMRLIFFSSQIMYADIGAYKLPKPVREHVYKNYIEDIRSVIKIILSYGITPRSQKSMCHSCRFLSIVLDKINAMRLNVIVKI